MYENFLELLEKHHLKAADVCRGTGLPSSLFSEWKKGKSTPKADKMKKIADFFGVTVDYLVTGLETSEKSEAGLSTREKREIGIDLDRIMDEIMNAEDGPLFYKGKPISDKHVSLLRNAMELAFEDANKKTK